MEEVISIQSKFYALGRSLRLEIRDITAIRDAYSNESDSERALEGILLLWLDQKYDAEKYGRPTWRMLVIAVDKETGGNDHELAKNIADQHPAGYIAIITFTPTSKYYPCDIILGSQGCGCCVDFRRMLVRRRRTGG